MTTQAEALLADRPDLEAGGPLLSVRDLRTNLLKPASFTLSAGECVVIRGPSGGGKTLLLRALADLDPNEGRPASGLRLALARALMVRPKVLLLDEPTAALDPASVGRSRNWSARA